MSTLMSRDLNLTRSSTRVRDPPGGKSSISFGDEYTAPAPVKKPRQNEEYSAPVPTRTQNRNTDYATNASNSGRSSLNFGGEEYSAPVKKQGEYAPQSRTNVEYSAPVRNHGQYAPSQTRNNITHEQEYENFPSQRANRRPSTSPDKSSMKGVVNQDAFEQPARRVRQQPGGTSSIVIG